MPSRTRRGAFVCIILLLFNVNFYSLLLHSIYYDFFFYIFAYLLGCVKSQLWHVASSLRCADSVVEAGGLWSRGFRSCGTWTSLLLRTWDLSFPNEGSNPYPLHRKMYSYPLDHQGKSLL